MQPFRDVKAWEKAHQLCLDVYKATEGFPRQEQYGLTALLRRMAVAVPAKIADGCGRGAERELARLLDSARGYAGELEYHLLAARDLGYLGEPDYAPLHETSVEVQKMLFAFARSVRARLEARQDARPDAKAPTARPGKPARKGAARSVKPAEPEGPATSEGDPEMI